MQLELLTDIEMLSMIVKERYGKSNNNYMKDYDKNKEYSHLKYWNFK